MPWLRAHGVRFVLLAVLAELCVFVAFGHTSQYAPSLLAAKFVWYPLYLLLPAVTSCAIGLGLSRVPASLEQVPNRSTAALAAVFVAAPVTLKCALVLVLGLYLPNSQVHGYLVNTALFVGLTIALPFTARRTVWIPVVAFYLCVFLGSTGDSVLPWAVLARPSPGPGTMAASVGVLVLALGLLPLRCRARRSAPVRASGRRSDAGE